MRGKSKGCLFILIAFLLIVGAAQSFKGNQSTPAVPVAVSDVVTEVTAEPTQTAPQSGDRDVAAVPTVTTRPLLVASPTPSPEPTYMPLSSGDSGEDVVVLQERLSDLGYVIGKADGDYGAKTVSAIKMVQVLAGLPITGIADDQTQQVIWGYDAPTPQPRPTPTIKPTKAPTTGGVWDSDVEDESDEADYIANKSTKKFHYPDCSSVDQMKEKNKWYFTGSRETLIKKGYDPCKRCDP